MHRPLLGRLPRGPPARRPPELSVSSSEGLKSAASCHH
jgi:hypothetical protein